MHPIARTSLEMNIVQTTSGPYLSAGQNQFRSLWTRDFCFSIRALFEINRADVVKNHLTRLIESRREIDGLVPRVLDSIQPRLRVLAACALPNAVRETIARPFIKPIAEPILAEYVDEHGSEAIDSNLLVLRGAFQYFRQTGDELWLSRMRPALEEIWGYYRRRRRGVNGPILQGPFTDWQDSLNRSGATLYTNVLLYSVLKSAAELQLFDMRPIDPENFRAQTLAEFYWPEKKLWRSEIDVGGKALDRLSLDYHLLGLECGFFGETRSSKNKKNEIQDDAKSVYAALKNSELWLKSPRGVPGFNSSAHYPAREKTWAVRLAGLERYHEDLYWSWLMSFAARIALQMGDTEESGRIYAQLHSLFERDQSVYEIYDPKDLRPFASRLYNSEHPFSWGC